MKDLLPIIDPAQFIDADGTVKMPKYAPGNPRNYRMNCSKAQLNINGTQNVTKPGESFRVLPIAFRILSDALFNTPHKRWCEVYFINQRGHLSMFMFHSYSLENLEAEFNRSLFYDELNYCNAVWTVTFQKKVNKENASYYLATFDFEPLTPKQHQKADLLVQTLKDNDLHIFRTDTVGSKTEAVINWSDPKAEEEVTPKAAAGQPAAKSKSGTKAKKAKAAAAA